MKFITYIFIDAWQINFNFFSFLKNYADANIIIMRKLLTLYLQSYLVSPTACSIEYNYE